MKNIHKKAFTLVELLVCICIIAILASMMFPSLNYAKRRARTPVCLSHMKQIGIFINNFTIENNDNLPLQSHITIPENPWYDWWKDVKADDKLFCPNWKLYSYRANWFLIKMGSPIKSSNVYSPSQKILNYEIFSNFNFAFSGDYTQGWGDRPELFQNIETHINISNFLFLDSHVQSNKLEEMMNIKINWIDK